MKNRKTLVAIVAIVAILALMLMALTGCGDDSKAKIDAAVKEAQEAFDKTKADLETQVTDLTTKLADAEAAAKKAAEDAETNLKTKVEEAVAAAQAEADKVKADLETQVTDLTTKLTDAEAAAKKAAEDAETDTKTKVEEAVAAAQKAAEETAAEVKAEADKAKTALEDQVTDLTTKLADAQTALSDAETKLKDAETKVADLEKQIADAAAAAAAEVLPEAAPEAPAEVPAEETKEEAPAEETKEEAPAEVPAEETKEEAAAEEVKVMSHADYVAAELDSEVTVETYVQATQAWWENKITVYAQSEDGAYFIYNMACSEEDAAKLTAGTKIRVKGFKSEWSGEVEITDATFEILEGSFIAQPEDVTAKLGTDELINCQNELVAFKGMKVEAQDDGAAFNYKNAENKTDDLYLRVSKDGQTYDFCVEFYLCNNETEVYKTVEGLAVGDVIDIEGFLYWYNGANPHMTKVTKAE